MSPPIYGVWATLLLPVDAEDRIDMAALGRQTDRLIESGVHGLYCNGTAGEFFSQSEAEFRAIATLLADKCTAAGRPFQIGCSHMDAGISLARVTLARQLHPVAIQIILPNWISLTAAEQVAFVARIAEAAEPVPLVLYNPPNAKLILAPAELGALARAVPAIAGFKLPAGDAAWYAAMRAEIGHLSVFVPGHMLATGLGEGAAGSYSNIAALNPATARSWYDQMLADRPAALAVEARLQAFLRDHIVPLRDRYGLSDPALDKLLAWIGGWTDLGLRLRWPLAGAPQAEAERLRDVACQALPDFVS